ncbi:hypothetical protein RvY_16487-1 [Ramazzottius varieornatus]|uniref:Receptor ligand binding region domain-containing protein n=1 Tax=Ramazzottius varieornatus TaxID=947166 RepID=A0A1D1W520_RAMVA|nr:hypothetical protein RvY_16487-1 [Ramazzottius varieornatus]
MNVGLLLHVTILHILWIRFCIGIAAETFPSSSVQSDFPKDPISVEIISVGNIHAASTLASLPYVAPGMSIALEKVQKSFGNSVSFKHTLLYDNQYKTCAVFTDNVDYLVSNYFYSKRTVQYNMTVFIGAGCTERLSMGKLIRGWNSLMMIGGAGETVFRNKKLYPNVVLGGNNAIKSHISSFTRFFARYSWSSIYVLLDSSATPWHLLVVGNLVSGLNSKNIQMKSAKTDIRNPNASGDLAVTLRDIRSSSRVIVFLGFPTEFRAFMLQVRTENMTNGDYVYVVNEPFHHRTYYGNLTWMYGTQRDQEAEQAFKSVFLITSAPETNTHLQTLENELKMRSLRDFNFTYAPDEKVANNTRITTPQFE